MDTRINFEIAKLLKEKGFNIPQLYFYIDGDISWKVDNTRCRNQIEGEYAAPTISEVVMWLYEKHGIWIVVNPHKGKNNLGEFFMEFDPEVWSFTNECVFHNTELLYFNSPTEAYEAAIKYCLTNLIK